MYWFKRHLQFVCIAVLSVLILLTSFIFIPLSAASAHESTSLGTAPAIVMVQGTPTEDATVTALTKEQLVHVNDWWWNYGATILTSIISTLTLAAAGVFAIIRYFNDRKDMREKQEAEAKRLAEDRKNEQEKRAEERFQTVVTGLGDDKEGVKISAAILLRTFLRPGYEAFYVQAFDLAVANLRFLGASHQAEVEVRLKSYRSALEAGEGARYFYEPEPASLTSFRQALIAVFKESFPLIRDSADGNNKDRVAFQLFDASSILLDEAFLEHADLKGVWMPGASLFDAKLKGADLCNADLRNADLSHTSLWEAKLEDANLCRACLAQAQLSKADLKGTQLENADLSYASLWEAKLEDANLRRACLAQTQLGKADLKGAGLEGADLRDASLREAKLEGANLRNAYLVQAQLGKADLRGAKLEGANLSSADLRGANLRGVNLRGANLSDADFRGADVSDADLRETNLSGANFLDTNLHGAKGLACEKLSLSTVDEDVVESPTSVTLITSSSTILPPALLTSDEPQTTIKISAQGGTSAPDSGTPS